MGVRPLGDQGRQRADWKLHVYWDGKRAPGYAPMKKQGAIILGIGGDNSCGAVGTFYEGVMTRGYTTDAADDAVQANIVAAGYKDISPGGRTAFEEHRLKSLLV